MTKLKDNHLAAPTYWEELEDNQLEREAVEKIESSLEVKELNNKITEEICQMIKK